MNMQTDVETSAIVKHASAYRAADYDYHQVNALS